MEEELEDVEEEEEEKEEEERYEGTQEGVGSTAKPADDSAKL